MPKFIYKPIDEVVHNLYKENTGGIDRSGDFPNGLTAELCVTADSEEEALQIRIMISHIDSWELVRKED
jgi:hypothetical protein